VRIEIKENIEEIVRKNATTEVNSSIRELSVLSVKCSEVMINKQNPSKLAEVFNICCEVLFAIMCLSIKLR
jgi:hypothetical protein